MNASVSKAVKTGISSAAFLLIVPVGMGLALLRFIYIVFLHFVCPPLAGPILQGLSFLMISVGAQMITQIHREQTRLFSLAGLVFTLIAFVVAAKMIKISMVGTKGYALSFTLTAFLWLVASIALGSIPRRNLTVIVGIAVMLCGIIVPPILAGLLARDFL